MKRLLATTDTGVDKEVDGRQEMDDAFKLIGSYGRYQKRLILWYSVYQMVSGYYMLAFTFAGRTPPWQCSTQTASTSSVVTADTTAAPDACSLFEEGKCVPVYSKKFTSIVSEWNLICSQSSLPNLTQSALFFGFLIGSWVFGWVADRMGRKRAFQIGYASLVVAVASSAVAPSYSLFLFCRFVTGFCCSSHLCYYVLMTEVLGADYRSLPAMIGAILFATSFPITALASYLVPQWRVFMMIGAVLLLGAAPLFRSLPESPRWLLVKGRVEEATAVLEMIARNNGVVSRLDFHLKPSAGNGSSSQSILDLFRSAEIKKQTVLLIIAWFTVCMVYYALSLGVGNLSSSLYISFSLCGLVEIPSNLTAYWVIDRLGRRWSNSGYLLMGGGACLVCAVIQSVGATGNEMMLVVLSLVGKFAISAAFLVVYVYSAELFPTEVRSLGIGVVNVSARTGGILAPLVILLDQYWSGLYMLVMGILAAATGVLCFSLPETINTSLPATLEDLESSSVST